MRSNKSKIIVFCLSVLTFFSCNDYLNVVPDDTPTIPIVFENRVSAETYLATAYQYLSSSSIFSEPGFCGGDEVWINELAERAGFKPHSFDIAKGAMSVGNVPNDIYSRSYQGIRDCNVFLENIHLPYDMTQTEKNKWSAEVKVLKAYYHFRLMRQFGPIIIVDENLPVAVKPKDAELTREPVDKVVDYCIKLIDEAIPFLSRKEIDGVLEARRMNMAVASAMKAKILVTAASPLFNGNEYWGSMKAADGSALISTTYDPEKWVRAATACQEAIDIAENEGFELYEWTEELKNGVTLNEKTMRQFSIIGSVTESKNNNEAIWPGSSFFGQQYYMAKMNDPLSVITQFAMTSVNQYISPTLRMAELFYSKNGVPIEEDMEYEYSDRFGLRSGDKNTINSVKFGYETINLHFNREPRFYASMGFDGGLYVGHGRFDITNTWVYEARAGRAGGFKGDPDQTQYSATGYLAKKLINVNSMHPEAGASFNTVAYLFPKIRLADLYLMYAEALNEASGPSDMVYENIDKVRTRAGLGGLKESWEMHARNPQKINNQDDLRNIIQQERMIELAFEGHRFWDLRRWKRAAEFMNNRAIMGWNIEAGDAQNFYSRRVVSQQTFTERDYFWPLALNVLLNNPKINQNPGW